MEKKNYKQKYLKYKAKYLELKRGGGNKYLTYKQIKKIFNELKVKQKNLYYEKFIDYKKEEKLEIINIEEKDKNLIISYKDVNNNNKESFTTIGGDRGFFSDPEYNLNIIIKDGNYYLKTCIVECKVMPDLNS